MNESKLNNYYQKIAQTVNEIIPEEWTKVFLYGEIAEGTGTAFFYYRSNNKGKLIYSHDIPELYNISRLEYREVWRRLIKNLKELSEEFKKNNQEQWTNLTFTLESTGKFKVDYDYEDLSDADDHERRVIWEYTRLDLLPESEYDKRILEEYLKKE
ncbi:antitoxin YezG family protein [Peribacillus butanolivorans]|uniref:antitoxin YezG family protein n=1 Tax=Peribacillus butanolivorans TaxID=421767 RepID=UPI002E1D3490|nr:antitoxin YezG family protein [Peribacillus butanolivorans]